MSDLPAVELLESTHTFPGPYMFKVIAVPEGRFVDRLLMAVRAQLDLDADPPYRLRSSASGRHVAVTLEPRVENAWEVLAVYRCIRPVEGLLMLW